MDFLGKLIGVVLLIIIVAMLMSLPIMWMWNYLMPEIFGLIEIGFGQALAMSFLSSALFKSSSSSSN